jgi:hypothetical protein
LALCETRAEVKPWAEKPDPKRGDEWLLVGATLFKIARYGRDAGHDATQAPRNCAPDGETGDGE